MGTLEGTDSYEMLHWTDCCNISGCFDDAWLERQREARRAYEAFITKLRTKARVIFHDHLFRLRIRRPQLSAPKRNNIMRLIRPRNALRQN